MRLPTILLLILFGVLPAPAQDYSSVTVDNKYFFDIETISDSVGIPENYEVYIKTPICEDEQCYQVEIIFYYDLIGRFLEFDTIEGKGLTKLDHIPFTTEDYQKLYRLLINPNSPIKNYRMDELVKNTRFSEIDGSTGATIEEVKEIVINGGVYSCFTLWQIAHGNLQDTLQQKTISLLSESLLNKLTDAHDNEVNYFLISSFSKDQFMDYLPHVLKTFQQAEGYYIKNAIEIMPPIAVNDSLMQSYFAAEFHRLNYFSQVALLKKLNRNSLTDQMRDLLNESLDKRNSLKNELIRKLLTGNNDSFQ